MDNTVVLFVCNTCGTPGIESHNGRGSELLRLLQEATADSKDVRIQPVACIGGCNKPCTVAISSPKKACYVFGLLSPNSEHVTALLYYTRLYASTPWGAVKRKDRPDCLKDSILMRIPPPEWVSPDGRFIKSNCD